jgi:hypothetical protein
MVVLFNFYLKCLVCVVAGVVPSSKVNGCLEGFLGHKGGWKLLFL